MTDSTLIERTGSEEEPESPVGAGAGAGTETVDPGFHPPVDPGAETVSANAGADGAEAHPAVRIIGFNAYYGKNQALKNISLDIPREKIFAFIGPSGCGKTTMLRSINRLNDLIPTFRQEGRIEIDGADVYAYRSKRDIEKLRMGIGMVFQQPNPLPRTTMQNMLFPLKEHYRENRESMAEEAVKKLKDTGLYDEIRDRLDKTAMKLSGGQQQRLCIARALMLNPKFILFDEPCSALDPISTGIIEELLVQLKENYTIIMVTHNMEQAMRIADYTAFFYRGEVVECNTTVNIFKMPEKELTQKYVMRKM